MNDRGLARMGLIFALAFVASAPAPLLTQPDSRGEVLATRNVMVVAMRDGVRLATDVDRPARAGVALEGRFPAIVERTPDNKEGARWPASFVPRGYVAVVQDVRGRYGSEGHWRPLRDDVADGYDTAKWIAEQAWSDGGLGTVGTSYAGGTQHALAISGAPALKAMVPVDAMSNFGRYGVRHNGAFELRWLNWVLTLGNAIGTSNAQSAAERAAADPATAPALLELGTQVREYAKMVPLPMTLDIAASWWIPALLASASIDMLCPTAAGRPERATNGSEIELATLSPLLSEPPGYFDTDNLISNESSYLQVADRLADAAPSGGVYVGVGPDQNFSYIARVRPRYAFIVDIRRQNLLEHLLFAALFARADDPYHYLCLLFSRSCPVATPDGAWPGLGRTLEAMPPPSEAVFAANLRAAYQHIEGPLEFALGGQDRDDIRRIYRAFFEEQAEIRFRSFGRPSAHHPTYRTLLLARSPSGRFGSFLDSLEDYRFVRDLSRSQRIVPVVGGFGGTRALRAIGGWMRGRGLTVSAFYTSNVEFYLLRDGAFERFVANLRELPSGPDSLLIRACFAYGRSHPAAMPGHRSVTLLERLPRFLELHDAGSYRDDWDLCTDYLH